MNVTIREIRAQLPFIRGIIRTTKQKIRVNLCKNPTRFPQEKLVAFVGIFTKKIQKSVYLVVKKASLFSIILFCIAQKQIDRREIHEYLLK